MIPSEPPITNAASSSTKRKTPEDNDMLGRSTKRSRSASSNPLSTITKRKHQVEEDMGGLVIIRGPPVRPAPAQGDRQPTTSKPSSSRAPSQRPPSTTAASSSSTQHASKPPSRAGSTSDTSRVRKKATREDIPPASTAADPDVEEDVRRMTSEAEVLRDRARASVASMTPAAQRVGVEITFPPSSAGPTSRGRPNGIPSTPTRKGTSKDTLLPLPERETPQIRKNRLMRGEHPSMDTQESNGLPPEAQTPSRRRSSLGMRGKRVSASFDTGIITRPHTSVADSSLYKHIDPDLPESRRMRQLLVWTAARAMQDPSSAGQRRKSISRAQGPPLPQLPPGGDEVLKKLQDEIIKMLAEGRIDTSVQSGPGEDSSSLKYAKENEQNVKNRVREKLFTEQIEERKKEDIAWAEVAQFYNAHQQNVLSSLQQRHRARTPTSAKVKGKQRASSHDPEDLEPWDNELPDKFRGARGYDVARQLLHLGVEGVGTGGTEGEDLQFKEDLLHAAISAAHQLTQMASLDLDHRFSLLNIALSQRTNPPLSSSSANPSSLSNFIPISSLPSSRQPRGPDPQDLLRALSRTDAERPRSKLGDAARRAAKDVQRVQETQAQAGESGLAPRKLTDVPPPTPRKTPGTPRRPSTPATGRKG